MRFFLPVFLISFCTYSQAQVRKICHLPSLPEISGIVSLNDTLWALNDGGNSPRLYRLDTTGKILDSTTFSNAENTDWEELCFNKTHVFIGDFGNNNGTRKDLRIFRFERKKLGHKNVVVDTISFFYPAQTDFTSNPFTLYDCEAFIAFDDSLVLFSKSYADAVCRVYTIPNATGLHSARIFDTMQLSFWVTGAAMLNTRITLCGYGFNGDLVPKTCTFLYGQYVIYHPSIVNQQLPLVFANQLESVIQISENTSWGAAEKSNSSEATLYEWKQLTAAIDFADTYDFWVRPNPADKLVRIYNPKGLKCTLRLVDEIGKIQLTMLITNLEQEIDISMLGAGNYHLVFSLAEKVLSTRVITIY